MNISMSNVFLFVLNENIINNFNNIILDIFTAIAILCAVLVVVTKNPIVSVLFLIGLFLSISVYLMILGMNFIGLSYLLVYVGAISILFLFILMLINIRISEIITTTSNSIPLSIIIGMLFFSTVYRALPISKEGTVLEVIPQNGEINSLNADFLGLDIIYVAIKEEIYKYYYTFLEAMPLFKHVTNITGNTSVDLNNHYEIEVATKNSLYLTYSQNWDSMLGEISHIDSLGNLLYTSFSLWIILTSLILLLAMVGAISITIKN